MVFFNTEVTQNEFECFLKEMSENYPYSKTVSSFPLLTPVHIGRILEASHFIFRFINAGPSDVKMSVTIDDVKDMEKTVPINIEILILSVFLETSLFSANNRTDIADIDFRNKEQTEIHFIRNNRGWKVMIEFI